MGDLDMRTLERNAATGDEKAIAKLRIERIRVGLDPMPEQGRFTVMDPLHLEGLRKTVEKVAKIAAKRGGEIPVTLIEAPEARWMERKREDGTVARIRIRDVVILGDCPDTGDWEYAALLHHTPSGTIIHRATAAKHPPRWHPGAVS